MDLGSRLSVLVFVGCGLAACGGSIATDAGNTQDSGNTADVVADASVDDAGSDVVGADASTIPVINACTSDLYLDMSTGAAGDRMIMMTQAHQFDMPCMTINAGQAVMFMWALATYPIAPGTAPSLPSDPPGTMPNPIQARATGSVYTVTFPTAGFYPYYVTGHDTSGLMGVIQVQ